MFRESLALKHILKVAMDTAAAPSTPIPSTLKPPADVSPSQGQMPVMPFANPFPFPQFGMGYGGFSMLYAFPPFFTAGASMEAITVSTPLHQPLGFHLPPLPPSSPPRANLTITEFCEMYGLGWQAEVGLERLGFHFRDNLNSVTWKEFAEAGFKPLEWWQVLIVYRQLKKDTHGSTALNDWTLNSFTLQYCTYNSWVSK